MDEKGTEAVAGMMSEIVAYSMPPIVKVDRPFHFMIYEETSRTLLFLGRVVNPTLLWLRCAQAVRVTAGAEPEASQPTGLWLWRPCPLCSASLGYSQINTSIKLIHILKCLYSLSGSRKLFLRAFVNQLKTSEETISTFLCCPHTWTLKTVGHTTISG